MDQTCGSGRARGAPCNIPRNLSRCLALRQDLRGVGEYFRMVVLR